MRFIFIINLIGILLHLVLAKWQCPGCCAVGLNVKGEQLCLCSKDCKCECSVESGCICPRDQNDMLLCKCSNIEIKPVKHKFISK